MGSVPNGMGSPSAGNGTGSLQNGMDAPNLPGASQPSLRDVLHQPIVNPFADPWPWATDAAPFVPVGGTVAPADEGSYAIETRAESIHEFGYGDAIRQGDLHHVEIGAVEKYADTVAGDESTTVVGTLTENARYYDVATKRLETTVDGRMTITAHGWPGALSGEDGIILGGALSDTWTGGVMIGAAMSDDMVIGAGVRITAPVDVWLNGLAGMEERPGTAQADGVFADICGTLFEREYGAAAAEPAPPAPPPVAVLPAAGTMVVGAAEVGVGTVRGAENFQDMGRVVGSASEFEEVTNLRHGADTADTLDNLSDAARNLDLDVPNGMGAASELPDATPPPGVLTAEDLQNLPFQHMGDLPDDGFQSPLTADQISAAALRHGVDPDDALRRLDDLIADRIARVGSATPEQIDQINTQIAQRLAEIGDAGGDVYRVEDLPGYVDKGGHSFIGRRPRESAFAPWPGVSVVDESARQTQLYAELDALVTIKLALDTNEDPVKALADALADLTRHGVPTPDNPGYAQWRAFTDAQAYLDGLSNVVAKAEMGTQLDYFMLARAELVAGRDPRAALQAAIEGLDQGSDTRRYAENVLDSLGRSGFNFGGTVPEALDTSALRDQWSEIADHLDAAARRLDDGTEQGYERARALRDVSGQLALSRMNIQNGFDPRDALLELVRQLEVRTFVDGGDGLGEASILRAAIAQYADLVDDFGSAANLLSSADDAGAGRAIAGVGQLANDVPVDPSPPSYASLFGDVVPGQDVSLAIDPPSYGPPVGAGAQLDNVRVLLDIEVEDTAAIAQDGVGMGARVDGVGVVNDVDVTPPVGPQMDEFGPRWVRVEESELATPGTFERVIAVDGAARPIPDHYEVVRLTEDTGTQTVAMSNDAQAVVESMAVRTAPEGADWGQTYDTLYKDYRYYRSESTWRVAAEYEEAIDGLRQQLRKAITDFGGDAGGYAAQASVADMHRGLEELLAGAETAEEARRIQEFLDGFNVQTYDVYADLAQRSDEFEGVRTGATFPLDRHIDQDKLGEWLDQRFMDAMANGDPTSQASRDEAAFFQQASQAVKDGRNPLQDVSDQVAYLQGKIPKDVAFEDLPADLQIVSRQIENFQRHQAELVDVLMDPAFHKSAAALDDDTYAPVHFLRPELGNPPPSTGGDLQTQIFNAEADPAQIGGGTDVVSGNYAANQEVINSQVGADDFARVPQEQPAGIGSPPPPADQTQPQGPRGILRNADAGGGPVGLDSSRIVNRGPDGENVSEEILELWAQRMLDESNEAGRRNQGGYANYMDAMADVRTRIQQMEDRAALNPYAAARVDAANQMWDAQRTVDLRSPSEWSRMPDTGGMRSWDHTGWRMPPTDRPRMRKSVRFGDAEVLTVAADGEDVRKIRNQWRDLDDGNAIMPWWTGSGINRTTDPLNTDEAVRHVPTPRMPDRKGYPSSWRASRQPGFGRVAEAPGAFPFNARERIITDLMQGKRIDASHIDLLQGTLNDAVRAGGVQHREWLRMTALVRDLKYGVVLGDRRTFASALDWRTLDVMLSMADSATAAT